MTPAPSDDLLVHRGGHVDFAERWYFNVQRRDGELLAITGGGLHRNRGTVECYACALLDGHQVNVRAQVPLEEATVGEAQVQAGPFSVALPGVPGGSRRGWRDRPEGRSRRCDPHRW